MRDEHDCLEDLDAVGLRQKITALCISWIKQQLDADVAKVHAAVACNGSAALLIGTLPACAQPGIVRDVVEMFPVMVAKRAQEVDDYKRGGNA